MDYENGSIPWMLKNVASNMLLTLLKKIEDTKDVVLSGQLIPVIDLICSYKVMKNIGVDKMFKIDSTPTMNSKRLCFIIESTINDIKKVCNWINVFLSKDYNDLQYWIVFVPQKSFDCERYLEQEGLYNYFTIWDFSFGFVPLDLDLFSLELNDLYQNYLLLGDYKFLNNVIKGMHQFQKLVGLMNIVLFKGRASEFICNNLQKLNALSGLIENENKSDCIIDLIVVDREEDYASLFLSQLNYAGILDETFPIKCGKIELESDLLKDSQTSQTKHNLSGADTIFNEVQDMSFSSVCISLKEKGQNLRQKYAERQSMNISEMKEFLAKELRNIQSEHKALFLHINICETIMEKKKLYKFSDQIRVEQNLIEGIEMRASLSFIEDGIIKLYPKTLMLRLICLFSICNSGISNKDLHNLIQLYTQSYGYQDIVTFFNLKKIGIIFETTNQFNFTSTSSAQKLLPYQSSSPASLPSEAIKKFRFVTKKFNLIPLLETESYNIRNPTDCGYVFGGSYYPYICKIVDTFFDIKSVSQIDDWCKNTQFKLQQSLIPHSGNNRDLQIKNNRIQIVLFVGGVTYAEVSAIRFLSKQKGISTLILTTSLTNGNIYLDSLVSKSF